MNTAVDKYVNRGDKKTEHVLSIEALYAANRALYKLLKENDNLTCTTIARNEAGDEIKYAFEGAFRNMTPDQYASHFHANNGGNFDRLYDALQDAPKTVEELKSRLDKAADSIIPNAEAIMRATANKQQYITSGTVLTPEQYVAAVQQIKEGVLTAARTARLPQTVDVEATEVVQPPAAITR
jgi:hypothetical protein